jgi:hypothetical protein
MIIVYCEETMLRDLDQALNTIIISASVFRVIMILSTIIFKILILVPLRVIPYLFSAYFMKIEKVVVVFNISIYF